MDYINIPRNTRDTFSLTQQGQGGDAVSVKQVLSRASQESMQVANLTEGGSRLLP